MRYKYIVSPYNGIVVAISHYAGKPVRGIAKCDPRDTFDEIKGRQLAKCRCDMKIATKRKKRAETKLLEAEEAEKKAKAHTLEMKYYNESAKVDYTLALRRLDNISKECARKNES